MFSVTMFIFVKKINIEETVVVNKAIIKLVSDALEKRLGLSQK